MGAFTLDWDWRTGDIVTSCEDNDDYPDDVTLKNLETMTITAVGSTNGIPVQLHIRSIMGTECDADAAAAAAASSESIASTDSSTNEGQWTCASPSSSSSSSDEITIES